MTRQTIDPTIAAEESLTPRRKRCHDNEGNADEFGAKTRRGLFVFSALFTTLYAGAFFGWGPMKLMLEDNGAFASQCEETNDEDASAARAGTTCAKQTASLLNAHMIAQLTMIFSPLFGGILDRFGAAVLMSLLGSAGCLGLVLLAIASDLGIDALLYPAFILLGFMAVCSSVIAVPTGLVFAGGRDRSRVISALNALFDAGSVTYLALWAIKSATGTSLTAIVGGYAALAVFCFGGAAYLWRVVVPYTGAAAAGILRKETALEADESSSLPPRREPESPEKRAEPDEQDVEMTMASEHATLGNAQFQATFEDGELGLDSADVEKATDGTKRETALWTKAESDRFEPEPSVALPQDASYVPIAERPPMQQLQSGQFVLLATFFAFHVAKNIFTLTTARDFLAYLGDDEAGHKYLTIFTLLMPASLAGLPFVDRAMDKHGYHAGMQLINILSLVHGIIQAASDNLNVQVIGFIVFSFFRCFLFSVVFSFLPTVLGGHVVGKGAGMLHLSAGVCSFLNIPLANVAVERLGGNFLVPNLVNTLLVLPCVVVALYIRRGMERERAHILG